MDTTTTAGANCALGYAINPGRIYNFFNNNSNNQPTYYYQGGASVSNPQFYSSGGTTMVNLQIFGANIKYSWFGYDSYLIALTNPLYGDTGISSSSFTAVNNGLTSMYGCYIPAGTFGDMLLIMTSNGANHYWYSASSSPASQLSFTTSYNSNYAPLASPSGIYYVTRSDLTNQYCTVVQRTGQYTSGYTASFGNSVHQQVRAAAFGTSDKYFLYASGSAFYIMDATAVANNPGFINTTYTGISATNPVFFLALSSDNAFAIYLTNTTEYGIILGPFGGNPTLYALPASTNILSSAIITQNNQYAYFFCATHAEAYRVKLPSAIVTIPYSSATLSLINGTWCGNPVLAQGAIVLYNLPYFDGYLHNYASVAGLYSSGTAPNNGTTLSPFYVQVTLPPSRRNWMISFSMSMQAFTNDILCTFFTSLPSLSTAIVPGFNASTAFHYTNGIYMINGAGPVGVFPGGSVLTIYLSALLFGEATSGITSTGAGPGNNLLTIWAEPYNL